MTDAESILRRFDQWASSRVARRDAPPEAFAPNPIALLEDMATELRKYTFPGTEAATENLHETRGYARGLADSEARVREMVARSSFSTTAATLKRAAEAIAKIPR